MATQYPPKKNTAFTLYFTLYKADGTVVANPGTITKKISKDGGAVADIAASVTKINTTYGLCSVVLSADEMNADAVSLYIVDDTSGCVPFTATILTTSATFAELKSETASILEDTGTTLPATLTTIDGIVDDILVDTGTTLPATLTALPVAIWNHLLSAMSTVGSIGQRLAAYFAITAEPAPDLSVSALKICNDALTLLGNNPIAALDENTKAARLCNQFYTSAVAATLRAYNWNCATARAELTADTEPPEFGFAIRYALPGDCLRVVAVSGNTHEWKIENGYILTNSAVVQIIYIKRISASEMDVMLSEAVAVKLASLIAFPLTNSATVAKAMFDLYKEKLADAHTMDAFENGTGEHLASDTWINARGQ